MLKTLRIVLGAVLALTVLTAHGANLVDNGGGLIYDTAQNITWAQPDTVMRDWDAANAYAAGLTLGGVSGWRQPTLTELNNMFYNNLGGTNGGSSPPPSDPDIGLFPTLNRVAYWSSTEYSANTFYVAYVFEFLAGNGLVEVKVAPVLTWLVRDGDVSPPTYSLSGSVSGLVGSVTLRVNGANDITLTANGAFTAASNLADGTPYDVVVVNQPATQTCTVTDGSGTIAGTDVGNVAIDCVTNSYTVGGTLSGLVGGDTVVLQNISGDDLSLTANGAFTFSASVDDSNSYAVTVLTQPTFPSETCTVTNGVGTLAGSNINNVAVTCTVNAYSIGGTISGLSPGNAVVLQNNGADSLAVSANGAFVFTAPLADATAYAVTVQTQPDSPDQTCSVTDDTGTLAGANISDVAINCDTNTYTVGGTLAGLVSGDTVVLQNNGGDDLSMTADSVFIFSAPVNDGAGFAITVLTQPTAPAETCIVTGGTGSLSGANYTSAVVSCSIDSFTVGGSVSGLRPSGPLSLQINSGETLSVTADGVFAFPTALLDGSSYAVTVGTQPTGQTCVPGNAVGALNGSDVSSIAVTCTANPVAVSATPRWLLACLSVLLLMIGFRRLRPMLL